MAWFVMLYGVRRLLTEFFRSPEKLEPVFGPLTLSQAICFTAALVASLVLLVLWYPRLAGPWADKIERLSPHKGVVYQGSDRYKMKMTESK